jgi:hypothetical protein
VEQSVDGGEGLGHDGVEAGGVDVASGRDGAPFVGGVQRAVVRGDDQSWSAVPGRVSCTGWPDGRAWRAVSSWWPAAVPRERGPPAG